MRFIVLCYASLFAFPTLPRFPSRFRLQVWLNRWREFISTTLKDGDLVTTQSLAILVAGQGSGQRFESPFQRAALEWPSSVSHLSAWLASFNADNFPRSQRIEVPGQYDTYSGRVPPNVASHAFIASVDSKMRTMPSLREPKRIAFIAHTEVIYPFLAKGGEDMRTDSRVEQLLVVINRLWATQVR